MKAARRRRQFDRNFSWRSSAKTGVLSTSVPAMRSEMFLLGSALLGNNNTAAGALVERASTYQNLGSDLYKEENTGPCLTPA